MLRAPRADQAPGIEPFTGYRRPDLQGKKTIARLGEFSLENIRNGPKTFGLRPTTIFQVPLNLFADPIPCIDRGMNSHVLGICRTTNVGEDGIPQGARGEGRNPPRQTNPLCYRVLPRIRRHWSRS